MPANGSSPSAHSREAVPSASQAPVSSAPPAVDLTMVTHVPKSTPNSIPAMDPAVSVRARCSAVRVNAKPCRSDRVSSVMSFTPPRGLYRARQTTGGPGIPHPTAPTRVPAIASPGSVRRAKRGSSRRRAPKIGDPTGMLSEQAGAVLGG